EQLVLLLPGRGGDPAGGELEEDRDLAVRGEVEGCLRVLPGDGFEGVPVHKREVEVAGVFGVGQEASEDRFPEFDLRDFSQPVRDRTSNQRLLVPFCYVLGPDGKRAKLLVSIRFQGEAHGPGANFWVWISWYATRLRLSGGDCVTRVEVAD